jgi:hypothetical protein
MKTRLHIAVLIALVSFAVALPAAAVPIDPDPDGVGIYFDESATVNCIAAPPLYVMIPAYVIATNLSEGSGLSGFALNLQVESPVIPPQVLTPGCPIGIDTDGDIHCGLATPVPWAETIILARIDVLLLFPDEAVTYTLGPTTPDYIPGFPVYTAGDDPLTILPLFPSAGRDATGAWRPVAALNMPCEIVGVEHHTWGALKSLYR